MAAVRGGLWLVVLAVHLMTEARDIVAGRTPDFPFSLKPRNETHVIPDDRQVSDFLLKGVPRQFFYLLQRDASSLSITLTPCTSNIVWSVYFRNSSYNGKVGSVHNSSGLVVFRGPMAETFSKEGAKGGLYTVQVVSEAEDSWVQLYASTMHRGGYPGLSLPPPKLAFQNRRARGEVTLRWPPSAVDPYKITYWVVVNPRVNYYSLCQVEVDRTGVSPPAKLPMYGHSGVANRIPTRSTPKHQDFMVEYAGNRTSVTLEGLTIGKSYYVDVFAVDIETNLSFRYASQSLLYRKAKPQPLRDSKPVTVNLKRSDGRAAFRFKAKLGEEGPLEWYVIACGGGVVDAEVRSRGAVLVPRTRVEGLARLALGRPPVPGTKYTLRLNATDPELFARITSVEVMASRRGLGLPELPRESIVHEYAGLRSCHSVTVGWLPLPAPGTARYCLRARETRGMPQYPTDQCSLEAKLNSLDFSLLQCWDIPHNRSVITEKVTNLRPGRSYEVQVTVKQGRSKMLSYRILYTYTRQC